MNKEMFINLLNQSELKDVLVVDKLFLLYQQIYKNILERVKNEYFDEVVLANYLFEEIYFLSVDYHKNIDDLLLENFFVNQISAMVFDKFFFNELNPYHAVSLVKKESPSISTIDLNLNFILNRIDVIKKKNPQKDILLDMINKAFLMIKTVNYLLISGAETEAFSTWRTIHELECVIKVIYDNQYVIPIYLQHIVYNNAFRDEFDDKEAQQAIIDDLKIHMKQHDLKSKDMKKYIEYGWLYSINGVENKEGFKLNFRNGLELMATLESYSQDYEMSSEVAHSSPLLIYSNKNFFKIITLVRIHESFLRLEEIFYQLLKTYQNVDSSSYEKMRNRYLGIVKNVLSREISSLKALVKTTK